MSKIDNLSFINEINTHPDSTDKSISSIAEHYKNQAMMPDREKTENEYEALLQKRRRKKNDQEVDSVLSVQFHHRLNRDVHNLIFSQLRLHNITQLNNTQLNSTQLNSTRLNNTQLSRSQVNNTGINENIKHNDVLSSKIQPDTTRNNKLNDTNQLIVANKHQVLSHVAESHASKISKSTDSFVDEKQIPLLASHYNGERNPIMPNHTTIQANSLPQKTDHFNPQTETAKPQNSIDNEKATFKNQSQMTYHFNKWQGEHSVKVAMSNTETNHLSLHLTPSNDEVKQRINHHLADLPPKYILSDQDSAKQQSSREDQSSENDEHEHARKES